MTMMTTTPPARRGAEGLVAAVDAVVQAGWVSC
jgi:hypothetical protein